MSDDMDLSTKLGLDALDKLTQEWWKECGIDEAVASIASTIPGPFKERAFNLMVGLLKQSHSEGLYRGFTAGRDFNCAELHEKLEAAREAIREVLPFTHPESESRLRLETALQKLGVEG